LVSVRLVRMASSWATVPSSELLSIQLPARIAPPMITEAITAAGVRILCGAGGGVGALSRSRFLCPGAFFCFVTRYLFGARRRPIAETPEVAGLIPHSNPESEHSLQTKRIFSPQPKSGSHVVHGCTPFGPCSLNSTSFDGLRSMRDRAPRELKITYPDRKTPLKWSVQTIDSVLRFL